MSPDEKLLIDSYTLLESNKIQSWVCHGTLLGLIREDRIIPWDHDIDLAVWADVVPRGQVRDIFLGNGFSEERIYGEMNCLHFILPETNLKVDISFYVVERGLASIKWICPTKSKLRKFAQFFCLAIFYGSTHCLPSAQKFSARARIKSLVASITHFLAKPFISLFSNPDQTLDKILSYVHEYRGYSYSEALLRDHDFYDFRGYSLRVPSDSARCLQETYGEKWMVPRANYIWHEEASNLHNMRY
jgi:hypothetical protein